MVAVGTSIVFDYFYREVDQLEAIGPEDVYQCQELVARLMTATRIMHLFVWTVL